MNRSDRTVPGLVCLLAFLPAGSTARGESCTSEISAVVAEEFLERSLADGDGLAVEFFVQCTSGAIVFGADLELVFPAAVFEIEFVGVAEHFGTEVVYEVTDEDGYTRLGLIQMQDVSALDTDLGLDGLDVYFATVWLNVLTDQPAATELQVNGKVLTLGRGAGQTCIGGMAAADGTLRLGIDEATDQDAFGGGLIGEPEWEVETVGGSMQVRAVGHDRPLQELQAGTQYELHYMSQLEDLSGFAIHAYGDHPESGFDYLIYPADADWTPTDNRIERPVDEGAEEPIPSDIADGFFKVDWAGDDAWPCIDLCAPSRGHLLDFTPYSSGTLILKLYLYRDYIDAGFSEEVVLTEVFDVVAP